jgi:hypothetical protein
MNKLFTSTLLTVVAVPFLMAAPNAAKKGQNQAPTSTADTQTTTPKVKAKKHVKKAKSTASTTATPAATTPAQK